MQEGKKKILFWVELNEGGVSTRANRRGYEARVGGACERRNGRGE